MGAVSKLGVSKMARTSLSKRMRNTPCPYRCSEKGQGISITTIVIAVLALIVLVVLIVIFTGQTGKFTAGTKLVQGGTVCETSADGKYPEGVSAIGGEWRIDCPAGQDKKPAPSYTPDVVTHYGMTCCNIGAGSSPSAPAAQPVKPVVIV